jgi:hypothetical protein
MTGINPGHTVGCPTASEAAHSAKAVGDVGNREGNAWIS